MKSISVGDNLMIRGPIGDFKISPNQVCFFFPLSFILHQFQKKKKKKKKKLVQKNFNDCRWIRNCSNDSNHQKYS